MVSHLKYTLVFDEKVDAKELEVLFQSNFEQNKQLLDEIQAEERLGEVLARKEDKAAEDNGKEQSEEEVIRIIREPVSPTKTRKLSSQADMEVESDSGAD